MLTNKFNKTRLHSSQEHVVFEVGYGLMLITCGKAGRRGDKANVFNLFVESMLSVKGRGESTVLGQY